MRIKLSLTLAVCVLWGHASAQIQKQYINPGPGYTNTLVVTSGATKTIYVSGQVGEGKNLETQIRSAFKNLEKQLSDAGAGLHDIVKMTTFIVRYKESDLDTFRKVRGEVLGSTNVPANTLVGVFSLFKDEYLVELEAVAVIEAK